MKFVYYFGRAVQAAGLLLILDALIVSALRNESMSFLLKFTLLGMAIFMVGWGVQKSA
ncbi:MAG: hypothetical protein ACE5GK_09800 [Nitrospiria bacterium]